MTVGDLIARLVEVRTVLDGIRPNNSADRMRWREGIALLESIVVDLSKVTPEIQTVPTDKPE